MGAQPAASGAMTSRRSHARALMIQGTASHVGKSVLTAGLCRLFVRRGLRVAPFKAQNMSNNSCVTLDGKEIGRAQAVQAVACRIQARVDFNPILIKPAGECSAQVIVNGVPEGTISAQEFGTTRRRHASVIRAAYAHLAREFDLILLEGAGSPAEINLRAHDLVNMSMAREARAPVLLIGDIDRGGAFASLFGTCALLDPEDRRHLKGFVINKFRGDPSLLESGIRELQHRTGMPCLGILPFWDCLRLPEEDSVTWDLRCDPLALMNGEGPPRSHQGHKLRIAVANLPYISNFTDMDALAEEPDVDLVRLDANTHDPFDAVILPGTKNTPQGLRFVRNRGIGDVVRRVWDSDGTIVGLCGGFQMLGCAVRDPYGVESSERTMQGLGLIDAVTIFERNKVTTQVSGTHRDSGHPVTGYEVHMGRTRVSGDGYSPLFDVHSPTESSPRAEGVEVRGGRVLGTYIHGVFDSPGFRRFFLNRLRIKNNWPPLAVGEPLSLDASLDRLADFVAEHVDLPAIEAVIAKGV